MEAFEAIYTRRSVRKFISKPLDADQIETLLLAAMSAPSAGNEQPWQFIVVTERKLLDDIAKVHPYAKMCLEVSLVIIACIDESKVKHQGFEIQDVSAATQNILLAARALDLGAVWLGCYPRIDRVDGMAKLFNLPKNIIPLSIIPVGYTRIDQERVNRYDKDRVHYNKW